MKNQNAPPPRRLLDEALDLLEKAIEPESKAFYFLRGVGAAMMLLRRGDIESLPQALKEPDFLVRRGLQLLLFDESLEALGERLHQRAESLELSVSRSLDDESVDEAVVHELVSARMTALDYDSLKWLARSGQIRPLGTPDFLGRFLPRLTIYQQYVSQLPSPNPVARRLQAFSRAHGIKGSPLFAEWDDRPDIEKAEDALAALMGQEEEMSFEDSKDFRRMPESLRKWDIALWKGCMEGGEERSLRAVAGSREIEATAIFAFPYYMEKEVKLTLTSGGLDENGVWTIHARTRRMILASDKPEGGDLVWLRLRCAHDPSMRIIAEARSEEEQWDLRVEISRYPWLVDRLQGTRKEEWAERLEAELRTNVDGLFYWILDTDPPTGHRGEDGP